MSKNNSLFNESHYEPPRTEVIMIESHNVLCSSSILTGNSFEAVESIGGFSMP